MGMSKLCGPQTCRSLMFNRRNALVREAINWDLLWIGLGMIFGANSFMGGWLQVATVILGALLIVLSVVKMGFPSE